MIRSNLQWRRREDVKKSPHALSTGAMVIITVHGQRVPTLYRKSSLTWHYLSVNVPDNYHVFNFNILSMVSHPILHVLGGNYAVNADMIYQKNLVVRCCMGVYWNLLST